MSSQPGFATSALMTSLPKDALDCSTSLVPPIMPASTYRVPSVFERTDSSHYFYGRYGNPSRHSLEATLAKLEGARHCMTFSSGMAAINAVVQSYLTQGDEIVASKQMYGGTFGYFREVEKFGIECNFSSNEHSAESIQECLSSKTKLVWFEICSNPLNNIVNVKKACQLIREYNKDIIIAVDNTYLSPYILKPLELGVDLAMHSCSKYLGGHSDVIMGSVATNRDDLYWELLRIQREFGATPSAFDCYLLQRSLCTLEVRMEKHHENSLEVAKYLAKHPGVAKILHPLLPDHPSHDLAMSQNQGKHSGMIALYVKGGEAEALAFLGNLKVISCAISLGGAHSLASHPSKLSHNFLTPEEKKELDIADNLIRLSVGLETLKDLLQDLDQALVAATGTSSLEI